MNPLARDHFLRFPARRPDRLIMGTDDGFWGITHSLRLFANDPVSEKEKKTFPFFKKNKMQNRFPTTRKASSRLLTLV